MICGITVSLRLLSSQVAIGIDIRFPLYVTLISISGGFRSYIFFLTSCLVLFLMTWAAREAPVSIGIFFFESLLGVADFLSFDALLL